MMWFEDSETTPTSNGVEYTTGYIAPTWPRLADVALDKDELNNVIEFIELNFIDSIRNDMDINNIEYIISMMSALQKFRLAYASINPQKKSATINQEDHE